MKKKRDFTFLSYICLVFLIILLLLPPILRLFGKNLYNKEVKKKDEIIILTCNKKDEGISSTFLNGEPQNLEYRINGDKSVSVSEEKEDIENIESFIDIIRPYASIKYNEVNDITIFNIKVSDLKKHSEYAKIFSAFDNQQRYFLDQEFSCQKTNYS